MARRSALWARAPLKDVLLSRMTWSCRLDIKDARFLPLNYQQRASTSKNICGETVRVVAVKSWNLSGAKLGRRPDWHVKLYGGSSPKP